MLAASTLYASAVRQVRTWFITVTTEVQVAFPAQLLTVRLKGCEPTGST